MKKKALIIVAVIFIIAVIVAVILIFSGESKENNEKPKKDSFETESVGETGDEENDEEEETTENVEAETEDYSDIVTDVEAVFKAALDYVVYDDELSAEQRFRNAILENTEITVNSANEEMANVSVKYPNAADVLTKASLKLPENATEKDVEDMYVSISRAIEEKGVEIIEETIDVELFEKDGIWNVKWTDELYDAVTGGLYSVE